MSCDFPLEFPVDEEAELPVAVGFFPFDLKQVEWVLMERTGEEFKLPATISAKDFPLVDIFEIERFERYPTD